MSRPSGPDIVDARVARTRQAVVAAVAALLSEEGVAGITHQRVAERSGVGRATLYRHWPTPVDLMLDALAVLDEPLFHHGEGPLRPWLLRELRRSAEMLAHPLSIQVMLVIVGPLPFGAEAADLRARILVRGVAPLADALKQAVISGELASEPNPEELVAELIGPVLFRRSFQRLPVGRAMLERIVDNALAPYVPTSAGGSRAAGAGASARPRHSGSRGASIGKDGARGQTTVRRR